jgi:hypothetical protein
MLRGMSGKRVEIARAMEFTLKKADAAEEVRPFTTLWIQPNRSPGDESDL